MRFEGFLISLANALGVPLGTKRRVEGTYSNKQSIPENQDMSELVNSVIDIVKDDVCVGETPLFYQSTRKRVPTNLKGRLDNVTASFNKIMKWVAFDILKTGVSGYTYTVKDDKLVFKPILDELEVFLRSDMTKKVVVNGVEIKNALIFVYYDKTLLSKVDDADEPLLRIEPAGIQTKNAKKVDSELMLTERAVQRLRMQSSKVIRYATVEVGLNVGNQQADVTDDISEGINANSTSLVDEPSFDDQIPVFPTRKGLGTPELHEFYSQANLGELTDLDYLLSKLFLALRFPKSYADFTNNLTPSAVSMIRGDIRYAKMLEAARSLIESTVNEFMSDIPEIAEQKIEWKLTQVPSSEDEDFIAVLSSYTDFATNVNQFLSEAQSKKEAIEMLGSLKVLYTTSSNAKSVELWYEAMMKVIDSRFKEDEAEEDEEDFSDSTFESKPGLGGKPRAEEKSSDLSEDFDVGLDEEDFDESESFDE